ncbi:hypothetical protein [Pedobacter sp. SYP-B3415]|uniref:hypothetical protein n=1 Tax=Pedobacter sp. SYP-B3415 TaxID=2496641 RepID=UPI00101DB80A|nr:hypothetical protein [Pedobacter sp. SYP-B3415]
MRFFYAVILLLAFLPVRAQQKAQSDKLIQFSGIITDVDSNTVIPYVTISNISQKSQRFSADYRGYFSFIVRPGDTLLFTAIGYGKFRTVVPKENPESKYTLMVKMKAESINLPTVKVFPWATVEEFTRDFLAMKIADDELALAKKNLSRESIRGLIRTLPADAGEISGTNFRYNFDRMANQNMVQTNPLMNPFAWGKLMQQIFEGDRSRKEN